MIDLEILSNSRPGIKSEENRSLKSVEVSRIGKGNISGKVKAKNLLGPALSEKAALQRTDMIQK